MDLISFGCWKWYETRRLNIFRGAGGFIRGVVGFVDLIEDISDAVNSIRLTR